MYHWEGRRQDQRDTAYEREPNQDYGAWRGRRGHERRSSACRQRRRAVGGDYRPTSKYSDGRAAAVLCAYFIPSLSDLQAADEGGSHTCSDLSRRNRSSSVSSRGTRDCAKIERMFHRQAVSLNGPMLVVSRIVSLAGRRAGVGSHHNLYPPATVAPTTPQSRRTSVPV